MRRGPPAKLTMGKNDEDDYEAPKINLVEMIGEGLMDTTQKRKKLSKGEKGTILRAHNKQIAFGEKNKSKMQLLADQEKARNKEIGNFAAIVGFDGPIVAGRVMTDKWWIIPATMQVLLLLVNALVVITTAKPGKFIF